ncbi:MAG: 3-dehydroquinate synthase [Clostridia bacterium]|nr:3-dehydroquinate synthase [Clostridia bacterium]
MKTVTVDASKKYNIYIGENIFQNITEYLSGVFPKGKICVVTDDIVDGLYGDRLMELLAGKYETEKFVIEHGEKSKNISTYASLLNFLAEKKLTRSDAIIAFGGGVVGDLAGFAAATYLRGIKYLQIPTTLLAMVDSSVGGKTAIDLDAGKNLCGTFYQPDIVICDYKLTETLSDEIFADGCAEIVKYSLIRDYDLFCHLSEKGKNFDREYVISRCVQLKSDIVAEDEFDGGVRQLLNYGHTVGHAIEALSNFGLTHGSAVAVGMAIIARTCADKGLCPSVCVEDTVNLIQKFNLPTKTGFNSGEIASVIENDKKRKGRTITLVVPQSTGKCILRKIPIEETKDFIAAGL